jgi:hypothetical protein
MNVPYDTLGISGCHALGRSSLPVPCGSWQLKRLTPGEYITLVTKSLPLSQFFVHRAIRPVMESALAEVGLFELHVISETVVGPLALPSRNRRREWG